MTLKEYVKSCFFTLIFASFFTISPIKTTIVAASAGLSYNFPAFSKLIPCLVAPAGFFVTILFHPEHFLNIIFISSSIFSSSVPVLYRLWLDGYLDFKSPYHIVNNMNPEFREIFIKTALVKIALTVSTGELINYGIKNFSSMDDFSFIIKLIEFPLAGVICQIPQVSDFKIKQSSTFVEIAQTPHVCINCLRHPLTTKYLPGLENFSLIKTPDEYKYGYMLGFGHYHLKSSVVSMVDNYYRGGNVEFLNQYLGIRNKSDLQKMVLDKIVELNKGSYNYPTESEIIAKYHDLLIFLQENSPLEDKINKRNHADLREAAIGIREVYPTKEDFLNQNPTLDALANQIYYRYGDTK